MTFQLASILSILAVLLVVPCAHANDILSTYPPFAKCDQNIINVIKITNKLFPSKGVYQSLASEEEWVMVLSSYNFQMSASNCVNVEVKDNWFNVTVGSNNNSTPSYILSYIVKEADGELMGQTVPDEPRRSWRLIPILAGDVIQAHYVCNTEYESKDTPLHGDIFVAKSALKNFYDGYSSIQNVDIIAKIMKPFTDFTFAATKQCLAK